MIAKKKKPYASSSRIMPVRQDDPHVRSVDGDDASNSIAQRWCFVSAVALEEAKVVRPVSVLLSSVVVWYPWPDTARLVYLLILDARWS